MECDPEVQEFWDYVLSTGGMVKHVAASPKDTFIVWKIGRHGNKVKDGENPGKTILQH